MSIKVAFIQLASCFGCHQSLLNAHLGLLPVLPDLEIVYWPAVLDYKLDSLKAREDGEIDVGFIEGIARTVKDVENLELMRAKCKIITTFGTCACMGGIFGLANNWSREELLQRKFIEAESITDENPKIPTINVPENVEFLKGADEIVKVDAYMLGCPPRTERLVSNILYLLGQKPFPMEELSFCTECSLNESGCLLDSGILCFGPITSKGCTQKCPDNGLPCVGCYGPSNTVSSRIEKLKEMSNNLENLDSRDKKTLSEFFTLFVNIPMLTSIIPVGPVLPKMPSSSEEIVNVIVKFLRKPQFPKNMKFLTDWHHLSTVCDTCPRIRDRAQLTRVKRDYETLPNEEDCLLEQGYVCLGPVTNAGCGALCIEVNAPCAGCYGPLKWGPPVKHGRFDEVNFAETVIQNFNTNITKKDLLSQIKDHNGIFLRYKMAKGPFFKGERYKGKYQGEWWLELDD
jgi:F420-non-reducing hydrogenase small subunit